MPTIEWESDFTKARQQYDQYISQIQQNPARAPVTFGAGGVGSVPGAFSGGFGPGSTGPVVGASSAVGAGNVQAAGTQVAQALASVANQIRAAGGTTLPGSNRMSPAAAAAVFGPGFGQAYAPLAGANLPGVATAIAGPGGLGQVGGGGGFAFPTVGGPQFGPGGAGVAAGGAGRQTPASARFGSGLSAIRGAVYGLGIAEGYHALVASSLANTNAQYADSPTEAIDAQLRAVDASTSGPFGTVVGASADALDYLSSDRAPALLRYTSAGAWLGMGLKRVGILDEGPTATRNRLVEQQAAARASISNRRDYLAASSIGRSVSGGTGRFGRGSADIANDYAGETADINAQIENLPDNEFTEGRRAALRARQAAVNRQRVYRSDNLSRGNQNDIYGFRDDASVARGSLTRGEAGRRALARSFLGSETPQDFARNAAELDAYQSNQGYQDWERTYAARGSRDQAFYRFRDQPHVAETLGIYNSGTLEAERARREGTPEEADLIRQRTRYELLGYQRQLLESGSAQFSEGLSVDTGQAGSTGLQSKKEGDDLAEVLSKLGELLAAVNAVNDSLN